MVAWPKCNCTDFTRQTYINHPNIHRSTCDGHRQADSTALMFPDEPTDHPNIHWSTCEATDRPTGYVDS